MASTIFWPSTEIHRQRLLAEDHLAGLGGGDGDLGVGVVGRADVDGVDVGSRATSFRQSVSTDSYCHFSANAFAGLLVPTAGGLEDRAILDVEEVVDPLVAVGVGPAHEAAADQADIQGFLGHARNSIRWEMIVGWVETQQPGNGWVEAQFTT